MIRCVYGPPGSGKSTYITEHAKPEDIIFQYDSMLTAISTRGTHEEPTEEQHHMVLTLRRVFLREMHGYQSDVWFTCCELNDGLREELGTDCEYIELTATKEELYDRVDKDDSRPDKEFEHEKIDKYFPDKRGKNMSNREYRSMDLRVVEENDTYMVEGYASTFDAYVLLTVDGTDYSERIEPTAFENADLTDVVFRVDHTGPVYARSSAGTVELWVDEHGLGQRTDLSKTQRARELFSDIAAGNYPQMSFAFTVAEDEYDKATHTRVIKRIGKVFDVSPVSFPANPNTELSVSTRDYFNGVIEAEKAERLEAEKRARQIQKIKILTEVM